MDMGEAIFQGAGQAVHVAFVVMAHEPMQDGPLRKALIRVMESIKLDGDAQRAWLQQLRGEASGDIHFGGLTGAEIRAQCAMITEAVKSLPKPEMWAIQARCGFTEYDDVRNDEVSIQKLTASLEAAEKKVRSATERLKQARIEQETAREYHLKCESRITSPAEEESTRQRYYAACDGVRDLSGELQRAESSLRTAQIALERISGCQLICNGRPEGVKHERRFVFSDERIAAIKGLADYFKPQFSRIKPFALDCLMGRMYAKHSQVGITFRDLASTFGGNAMQYQRASHKLSNRLRELETMGLERLEARLIDHGVVLQKESA